MVTVQELAGELGVSPMTVHRDLNRLAGAGQLEKTRGGAALRSRTSSSASSADLYAMCHRVVPERSAVVIQSAQVGRLSACCPHCGLALLDQSAPADLVLVTDFLYGRMISAQNATFVVGSQVWLCCGPGVLAFSSLEDAGRFQRGFGGEVMNLLQAQESLRHQ
jgi:DeoR family transcriptional regulator, copper-sensing transcriptional repressor